MVVAMNGINLPVDQNKTSYITALCDVVPNKKRDERDFQSLLQCLEEMPKECTPFKGKILLHLKSHALENPNANIRLIASCFSKATLLYRKTPNKSEGPVGCWKSGLKSELITLEENLNQLYSIAGLNTSNVLSRNRDDNGADDDYEDCLKSHEKLSDSTVDFENTINEHLLKINLAAHNVCALISVQTDFDLPIPVFILLKLAAKIGLIRWKDYKKKPSGMLKNYVYSLAPCLLETNLMLFKTIITVLGTNIIPFTTFINQTLIRILDWTRSSNLLKYYEDVYYTVRSQVFKTITFIAEQLSLNINLEPQQLKVMLTSELIDSLEELHARPSGSGSTSLKCQHIVDALECLENLLIIYRDLLDATLESKCKSYVIQTCLGIYRDFGSNSIGQTCRRKLLELLQTIANQPYATSTTEIAYHIFELAEKFEGDPEMRSLARRSLKIGLAHRPTIVTHHDVYNCYGRPMLSAEDLSSSLQSLQQESAPLDEMLPLQNELPASSEPMELVAQVHTSESQPELSGPNEQESIQPPSQSESSLQSAAPSEPIQKESSQPRVMSPAPEQLAVVVQEKNYPSVNVTEAEERDSPDSDIMISEQTTTTSSCKLSKSVVEAAKVQDEKEEEAGKEDSEINSYMSFFVEKLA